MSRRSLSLAYLKGKIVIDTATNEYYRVSWIYTYVSKKKDYLVQGTLVSLKHGPYFTLGYMSYADFCMRFQQADPYITEVLFGKNTSSQE